MNHITKKNKREYSEYKQKYDALMAEYEMLMPIMKQLDKFEDLTSRGFSQEEIWRKKEILTEMDKLSECMRGLDHQIQVFEEEAKAKRQDLADL